MEETKKRQLYFPLDREDLRVIKQARRILADAMVIMKNEKTNSDELSPEDAEYAASWYDTFYECWANLSMINTEV